MRQIQFYSLLIGISLLTSSCVTHTINSDGSLQSAAVDKTKLADTYVDLAVEYQQHNAPQIALERANLAIANDPSNARAYMVRGMIYKQLKQSKSAEDDFKHALAIASNYPDAYINYAQFLCDEQRYSEAYADFNIALNNSAYFTPEIGYASRGMCYYKEGNLTAAADDFVKSLSYPNIPQNSYLALAKINFRQGNYSLADYYITKFAAATNQQTAPTLWLHIQILQALLNNGVTPLHYREYNASRNALAEVLLQNYRDSMEAKKYIAKYGEKPANSGKVTLTPGVAERSTETVMPLAKADPVKSLAKTAPKVATKPMLTARILTTTTGRRYVQIKSGETLYSISRDCGVSVNQLQKINHLTTLTIKSGLRLYLDPR